MSSRCIHIYSKSLVSPITCFGMILSFCQWVKALCAYGPAGNTYIKSSKESKPGSHCEGKFHIFQVII